MSKDLDLITPGEILLEEFMKPYALTQSRLAHDLNVNVTRIRDIIHGRRTITADTALRLAKYFDTSPELWLGLQLEYDVRKAQKKIGKSIADQVHVFTGIDTRSHPSLSL
jgi:addiction module HigA family antidote